MIFDWLRGRPKADPDEIRERLFEAAARGDDGELGRLCREHEHLVLDTFGDWKKVPSHIRDDVGAVQRWGHGLMAVARFFAEELSQPELIQELMGNPEDNPLTQWQRTLAQAQDLMHENGFREAARILSRIIESVKGLSGSGVDTYLPVTLGMLGDCLFQCGEADRAAELIEEAAALCEQYDETDGLLASLGNLYEVHRYRQDAPAAAGAAERLAAALHRTCQIQEAQRYRKLAAIVRAGEPLVRIVAMIEGRPEELDDLRPRPDERVQLAFERNRVVLRPALAATARGERLAASGKFDQALIAFREAARADPHDPQPRYLEGLTLLHLNRPAEAVEAYDETERLAPGWFHVRAQVWLARELAASRLPHEAFLTLRELEDAEQPPDLKSDLARKALQNWPQLAPVHLVLGNALLAMDRVDEAKAAFRKGLECAREPDVASRLRLCLALSGGAGDEGAKMLEAAREPGGNLVAAAMATIALRTGSI
ncbi:MAG: tetratricopeptide repeat protein [Candidatus Riflebacteria bacterium]|nr:tetratricopeptide repeat protein [Candidatus Riflebacteria bacterium]